jgi:hypothetical protein
MSGMKVIWLLIQKRNNETFGKCPVRISKRKILEWKAPRDRNRKSEIKLKKGFTEISQ